MSKQPPTTVPPSRWHLPDRAQIERDIESRRIAGQQRKSQMEANAETARIKLFGVDPHHGQ